jgi:hypothetical protein
VGHLTKRETLVQCIRRATSVSDEAGSAGNLIWMGVESKLKRMAERTRTRPAVRYPGVATPNQGTKVMRRDRINTVNSKTTILVSVSGYFVPADPDRNRGVAPHFDVVDGQLGASMNTQLAIQLSPHEAR